MSANPRVALCMACLASLSIACAKNPQPDLVSAAPPAPATAPNALIEEPPPVIAPTSASPSDAGPVNRAGKLESIADGSADLTRLPPDYLHQRLLTRDEAPDIAAAYERVLVGDTPAARQALIRAIELDFVHRADTSSLDLLGPGLSGRLQAFGWHEQDYPGGAEGPGEDLAHVLADALDIVTPERRANRARVAVIRKEEATDAIWAYMLAQWEPVPGETRFKLNRHAVAGYLAMREAAAADGVALKILSGHRDPARARANAARVGNSFAVASFSSHSLGLAIDFELPRAESDDRFRLTTRPMGAVVAMRRSPVHKWLHLHGHKFGWYPFQHEPWHWEYNPRGFREVFFADFPDGPPPR